MAKNKKYSPKKELGFVALKYLFVQQSLAHLGKNQGHLLQNRHL